MTFSTCMSCARDLGGRHDRFGNCDSCAAEAIGDEARFRELMAECIEILREFGLSDLQMPAIRFLPMETIRRDSPGSSCRWAPVKRCLYFPQGMSETSVYVLLIRILAHVWRAQQRQVFGRNELEEGFSAWVAFRITQEVWGGDPTGPKPGKAGARGFQYLLSLEAKRGRQAVIERARRRATLDLADWLRVVGKHWRWVLTDPSPEVSEWIRSKFRGMMV